MGFCRDRRPALGLFERHSNCETNSVLGDFRSLDQRSESLRALFLRAKSRAPASDCLKDRLYPRRIQPRVQIVDKRGAVIQKPCDGGRELVFDLHRWNPPATAALACGTLQQASRNIVAIMPIAFDRVTRRQPFSRLIEEFAQQRTTRRAVRLSDRANDMQLQELLSLFPRRTRDDRLMLPRISAALVSDFTNVNRIAQYRVKRPAGEWLLT